MGIFAFGGNGGRSGMDGRAVVWQGSVKAYEIQAARVYQGCVPLVFNGQQANHQLCCRNRWGGAQTDRIRKAGGQNGLYAKSLLSALFELPAAHGDE